MGGENESTLKADPKPETVLRADERIKQREKKKKKDKKKNKTETISVPVSEPIQTQNIRQHMNGGEIHFHDDEGGLKTAIPVAEWYTGIKTIRSMQPWQYVDSTHETIATFRPFVRDGVADCTVTVESIEIGERLTALNEVAVSK